MTRINVVDPCMLSNKHLGAEYRELPRVFGEVRKMLSKPKKLNKLRIPATYRLGKGHVTFFYDKLGYLIKRYQAICDECRKRNRVVNYGDVRTLIEGIPESWFGDWEPTEEAVDLNIARINQRGGLREIVPDLSNRIDTKEFKMKILNIHKATEQEKEGSVYIGRGSPLGNPYPIGETGTREEVIRMYRTYLANKIISRVPDIEKAMRDLKADSKLLCFCSPKPCHGAVIEEYWNDLQGYESYEEALRHFKNKHNKDRILYRPEDDGVTHINVYSKGKTRLGQLLSNFAHAAFVHPVDGYFASVEGYWYWLSVGNNRGEFRSLHGYKAKELGKILRQEAERNGGTRAIVENFNAKIKKAILCKIEQNEELKQLLKESTLPLTHYYVWGKEPDAKITYPEKYAWIHEYISDVRDYLNGKAHKLIVAGTRTIDDYLLVKENYFSCEMKAIEIVSGKARGPDRLGEQLANELELPIADFPADWDGPDKNAAGFVRNGKMADYGSAGLIFWDGKSNGTQDMTSKLHKKSKPVKVVLVGDF